MKYKKIELDYKYDAFEPFLDKQTMKFHYEKHHTGYENKLNKSIEFSDKNENLYEKFPTVISLMKNYQKIKNDELRVAVREFGGGLINHNFFFKQFKLNTSLKDGKLKKDIENQWGSFEKFKESFKNEAVELFGSGWVWFAKRKDNSLKLIKTFNQDNPWFLGFKPLIGIDLWEHSYYLKHNSNKQAYFEDFFSVLNWEFVEKQYNED